MKSRSLINNLRLLFVGAVTCPVYTVQAVRVSCEASTRGTVWPVDSVSQCSRQQEDFDEHQWELDPETDSTSKVDLRRRSFDFSAYTDIQLFLSRFMRLADRENFVGEWEEFIFNAFINLEQVKRSEDNVTWPWNVKVMTQYAYCPIFRKQLFSNNR